LNDLRKEIPILIKFIDAQTGICPSNAPKYAIGQKTTQIPLGKQRLWYIMDADKGAELIVGFN